MNRWIALLLCLLLNTNSANATPATVLPDEVVTAFVHELSGETAKSNLEYIARFHRMRGSRGFRSSAEFIVKQLRDYGLTDARPAHTFWRTLKQMMQLRSSNYCKHTA